MFVRFEADVIAKPCLPYFIAVDRETSSVGRTPRDISGAFCNCFLACTWLPQSVCADGLPFKPQRAKLSTASCHIRSAAVQRVCFMHMQ